MRSSKRFRSATQGHRPPRRGIAAIEVLAVLPLLLIFALSIAEFSSAMRVQQKVAFVSDYGARLAARAPRIGTNGIGSLNLADGTDSLKSRIDQALAAVGISASQEVLLEHSACGIANPVQRVLAGDARTSEAVVVDAPLVSGSGADLVRVTVVVRLGPNVPNTLRSFGLNWDRTTVRHATTLRIETPDLPPVPVLDIITGATASSEGSLEAKAGADGRASVSLSARRSYDVDSSAQPLRYRWSSSGKIIGSATQSSAILGLELPPDSQAIRHEATIEGCDCKGNTQRVIIPIILRRD